MLTTKAPLITVTEETKDAEYCTVKTEVEICVQSVCIRAGQLNRSHQLIDLDDHNRS